MQCVRKHLNLTKPALPLRCCCCCCLPAIAFATAVAVTDAPRLLVSLKHFVLGCTTCGSLRKVPLIIFCMPVRHSTVLALIDSRYRFACMKIILNKKKTSIRFDCPVFHTANPCNKNHFRVSRSASGSVDRVFLKSSAGGEI